MPRKALTEIVTEAQKIGNEILHEDLQPLITKKTKTKTPEEIKEQIFRTYIRLRYGLGFLSFILLISMPIGLYVYGFDEQTSISAYYFVQPYTFPMRRFFVGILFTVGVFLVLYKGFSDTENAHLNIAGLSAILVAIVPMTVPKQCLDEVMKLAKLTKLKSDDILAAIPSLRCGADDWAFVHYIAAGVLFYCMARVAWACRREKLGNLSEGTQWWLSFWYGLFGWAMILVPPSLLAVWLFEKKLFPDEVNHQGFFWAEVWGVVFFALFWLAKSRELRLLLKNNSGDGAIDAAISASGPATVASSGSATSSPDRAPMA